MASTKWQEIVDILCLRYDHLYRAIYDQDMPSHTGARKQLKIMHKIALTSESRAVFIDRLHVLAK